MRGAAWVATLAAADLPAGAQVVRWDGSKRVGRLLDGAYTAEVDVTDAVGPSSFTQPFTSDVRPPVAVILPGKPLRVRVSEPCLLTVRVDGRSIRVAARAAGIVRIPGAGAARHVRVVAWDAAGNVSRPVVRPGAVVPGQ
jgi:hypothetical protein